MKQSIIKKTQFYRVASLDFLPNGIYIVNGKKILKK